MGKRLTTRTDHQHAEAVVPEAAILLAGHFSICRGAFR